MKKQFARQFVKSLFLASLLLTYITYNIAMEPAKSISGYEKVQIKDLNTFDNKAASVLIRFGNKVLLGRESRGRSKGLYADFGGFKSRENPRETPIQTAVRELSEESNDLLGNESELQTYIDPNGPNTTQVVANVPLKHVMFITNFDKEKIEKFAPYFFITQKEVTQNEKMEKDELAFVNWQEMYEKIRNTPRDEKGFVKDVTLNATEVYDANGKRTNVPIIVRAGLVAVLHPYFNDPQGILQKDKIVVYQPR